jgi:hypothetical protein
MIMINQMLLVLMLIIAAVVYFGVLVFGDIQLSKDLEAVGTNKNAPTHRGQRTMCDTNVPIGSGKHRKA